MKENNNILTYYYNIIVNGIHVERNIPKWDNALKRARTHTGDLFGRTKVEILNVCTGEIEEVL